MTKPNAPAGSGKNQAADSTGGLHIPTLGSGPIVQPGEDAEAIQALEPRTAASYASSEQSYAEPERPVSLADLQREISAKPRQAMHRPVNMRHDREQYVDNDSVSLEMPLTGSIDNMRRPDQRVEPVGDMMNWQDKAETTKFMEEMVMVRIHETGEKGAENPVFLSVNGRPVYIWRGQDTVVRRYYVEQLMRARPETLETRIERDGQGNPKNFIDKRRALKYPFSIVRDDNPKGRAWERRISQEA